MRKPFFRSLGANFHPPLPSKESGFFICGISKMNALTTAKVTMTSIELVDFINSQRKEDDAELRHDSFMVKVPKVLGVDAPKFFGTQNYGNNNTRNIYTLPKRESCLMAMSYSYELQAKVFDRMTELEKCAAIRLNNSEFLRVVSVFKGAKSLGLQMKMTEDESILFANKTAHELTGFNVIKQLNVGFLNKPVINQHLNEIDNTLNNRILSVIERNNGITLGVLCNRLRQFKKSDVKNLLDEMITSRIIRFEIHHKPTTKVKYLRYFAV